MSENANREEELFQEALRKSSAGERAAFLDGACQNDPPLRARLELLIEGHLKVGGFLDTVPAGNPANGQTVASGLPVSEKPGDRIGRYKLLQRIGEGGCGVVYMAEQEEPVRRRVALKIIKLGMDTRSVIARFEAERQALALMDHPNIAKVLDAGATETGRPYFVMELVRGVKITDYCDQNNLSTRERLGLVIQVCHAIQHAHQKGVIHRDIKPSNVLVTLHDGEPVPKVIDFGIAKATQQRLTDKTLFTAFEQFIGTPAYMSPEQAELSGLDIDTRSDVYSLGVLLYELLTGKTPFDAKDLLAVGIEEMRRTIREKEPARPSTRLSTMIENDLTTVAKHRQSDPPRLIHLLRGDLDWIVMKALEKDRTRRYVTAEGLALDIKRHLENEPVVARPPSTAYRVRKFVRRNRIMVAAASIVVIVLILGAFVSTWQAIRATRAERTQSRLREEAEAALGKAKRAGYQANLHAAEACLNAHAIVEARRRLDACDPELRNWEWRHLNLKSDSSLRSLCSGKSAIKCFGLSPDGRWIAVGSDDGLAIWDAESGKQRLSIDGIKRPSCLAFSPNAKLLAAGSSSWSSEPSVTARVWRMEPLQEVFSLEMLADEAATCLAFGPTGKTLLVGSGTWIKAGKTGNGGALVGKGMVRICSLDQEREIKVLGEQPGGIVSVGMTRDGDRVVSTGTDVQVWDAVTGKLLEVVRSGGGLPALPRRSIVIQQLISEKTGLDGKDRVFEQAKSVVAAHPEIRALSISPDLTTMVTGSTESTIQLWDLKQGTLLRTYQGHLAEVSSVVFSPDGLGVVSLGEGEKELKQWDLTSDGYVLNLQDKGHGLGRAVFTPNGRSLITGNTWGEIMVWSADTGSLLSTLPGRVRPPTRAALSPDGRHLAVVARENPNIEVWDISAEKTRRTWEVDSREVTDLAFSPNGQQLATASREGLRVWDAETGTCRADLARLENLVRSVVYSPDGKNLAADQDGNIHVFDAGNGRLTHVIRTREEVLTLAYHPDGRRIASASARGVLIWDIPSGKLVAHLQAPDGWWTPCLAFSPDGTRLARGGHDGIVRLWDVETHESLLMVRGREGVASLAWSSDGTRIAAVAGDLVMWQTESPAVHHEARRASALLRKDVEPLVAKLFAEHLEMTKVLEWLKQDTSVGKEVREAALRMTLAKADPNVLFPLNNHSWEVVSRPGQPTEAYQQALRQAEAACAIKPIALFLNTLGAAQFRVGRFEEALATLRKADGSNLGSYDRALDLLFIAMCHKQLGRLTEASASLAEARTIAGGTPNEELAGFLREATALLGQDAKQVGDDQQRRLP